MWLLLASDNCVKSELGKWKECVSGAVTQHPIGRQADRAGVELFTTSTFLRFHYAYVRPTLCAAFVIWSFDKFVFASIAISLLLPR